MLEYIEADDPSFFDESFEWLLQDRKKELFQHAQQFNATKCIDVIIERLGIETSLFLPHDDIESFEKYYAYLDFEQEGLTNGPLSKALYAGANNISMHLISHGGLNVYDVIGYNKDNLNSTTIRSTAEIAIDKDMWRTYPAILQAYQTSLEEENLSLEHTKSFLEVDPNNEELMVDFAQQESIIKILQRGVHDLTRQKELNASIF